MNKKIFRACFFTAVIVLLISLIMIFGVLFEYFENQIMSELKSKADYIGRAIQSEGISYIDNFDGNEKRITLISPTGEVIADTSADPQSLGDHSDRAEFKDALTYGSGSSSRYSDTMMHRNLYYATKLSDGNVLRVSTTQNSVVIVLIGLTQPILAIMIAALILSLIISGRVSKAIIEPINALDLENPEVNEAYEELTPLLKKISAQNKTIDKQIKDAKQKQEEFRLITENMNEGLLVIDNQTNVLTYNKAALRLLEIKEFNSGSVLMLNRTKGFRDVIERVLEGERAVSDISLDEHTYNLIANPVFEDSKVIGAVIVIIDVTESAKREQLRREFTSNVSHELKTPLTSISGFAEILKSGGTSDETVVDFSTSIYDEAQRLISLVNDIMKISELDEHPVQTEPESVDLYKLSENIIGRLKQCAEKRNITLSIIGASTIINGSKKILDEMIYNLCDNAVKYNKEGGSVDVILEDGECEASISVRDTGIGIPAADQGRVFERFYRVDKSHSKEIGGTGLGLSIVKHGALYHNAEITLESTEGKGTLIKITFKKTDKNNHK